MGLVIHLSLAFAGDVPADIALPGNDPAPAACAWETFPDTLQLSGGPAWGYDDVPGVPSASLAAPAVREIRYRWACDYDEPLAACEARVGGEIAAAGLDPAGLVVARGARLRGVRALLVVDGGEELLEVARVEQVAARMVALEALGHAVELTAVDRLYSPDPPDAIWRGPALLEAEAPAEGVHARDYTTAGALSLGELLALADEMGVSLTRVEMIWGHAGRGPTFTLQCPP